MTLYKYRSFTNTKSFEYTIDSLVNKYLYFSRPSELNDPFDCQIQIETNAKGLDFKLWVKEILNESDIDKKLLTVEEVTKKFQDKKVQNGLKFLTQLMVESNHLLSLTSDCLNESMWALYAGNYNGICIGYNTNGEIPSFLPHKIEFIVEGDETIIPSKIQTVKFKKIEYDNTGKHVMKLFSSRVSQVKEVIYNLRHKKDCWATEKEYRAIIHDADYDIFNQINKTVKVFYDDNLLEEIIFGDQVPLATVDMIIEMIRTKYCTPVKFYKIRVDLKKYCLVKEEI